MSGNDGVNIALGVVGVLVCTVGALVAADHHRTFSAVLPAVFADVFVIRTGFLLRKRSSRP